jgi:predicted  nucleic acid-binding Zn-ribbon protein
MEELDRLYRLQSLDLTLREKEEQLRRLRTPPASIREAEEARLLLAKIEQERQRVKSEMKDHELQVDTIQTKIQRLERELFSGKGGAKELLDKQTDQHNQRSHKNALEDRILEMMEQLEELDRQVAEARRELIAKEEEREKNLQDKALASAALEEESEQIRRQREEFVPDIPPELLSGYENQRKHLQGQYLSLVTNGSCQGCGVHLASAELIRLRKEGHLPCGNCGRILLAHPPD